MHKKGTRTGIGVSTAYQSYAPPTDMRVEDGSGKSIEVYAVAEYMSMFENNGKLH